MYYKTHLQIHSSIITKKKFTVLILKNKKRVSQKTLISLISRTKTIYYTTEIK